jgi:hypothetical protein
LRKLERSGLRRHFSHVEVPPEKDEAAYRRLVGAAALDRSRAFKPGSPFGPRHRPRLPSRNGKRPSR